MRLARKPRVHLLLIIADASALGWQSSWPRDNVHKSHLNLRHRHHCNSIESNHYYPCCCYFLYNYYNNDPCKYVQICLFTWLFPCHDIKSLNFMSINDGCSLFMFCMYTCICEQKLRFVYIYMHIKLRITVACLYDKMYA